MFILDPSLDLVDFDQVDMHLSEEDEFDDGTGGAGLFGGEEIRLGEALEVGNAGLVESQTAIEEAEGDEDPPGRLLRRLDRSFRQPESLAALELSLVARSDAALAESIGPAAARHRAALRPRAGPEHRKVAGGLLQVRVQPLLRGGGGPGRE